MKIIIPIFSFIFSNRHTRNITLETDLFLRVPINKTVM
jgi:hypothetical protein